MKKNIPLILKNLVAMKKELFFKRLLSLVLILCSYFTYGQDFSFTVTDANMTVQVSQNVVLIEGAEPECGSLLGGFFTNPDGDLQCAGYQEWCTDFSNGQLAIALMASETGLNNGFATGEEITWILQDLSGNAIVLDVEMNSSPPFSDTFI